MLVDDTLKTMQTVEIIGAVDGQPHYATPYIVELLATDLQALALGTDFVGRPGTLIYTNEADVVKVRADFDFTADKAREWMQETLQTEQVMGVHHPYKTWLLIIGKDNKAQVASICPRLEPLHIALKSATKRQRNLALLTAVFKLYLVLAKNTGKKLDEGLSNFAVSADGQVYYLDDEYYPWDDFVAFSIMLGVFIRGFIWFDEPFIDDLAHNLTGVLRDVFQDIDCQYVIASHLQPLFMPNEEKERLLKRLVKSLMQPPATGPVTPSPFPSAITGAVTVPVKAAKPATGRFFALLADIHGNSAALERVLDYLKSEHIHEGIVLGDIVGYGPDPKACIERLQDSPFLIIKGNHDHGVATGETSWGFSRDAKAVAEWTINELSADHRRWLNELPAFIKQDNWYAVHGAPMDENYFYAYVYLMTYQDNLDYMQQNNMTLCFHGHSHLPGVYGRVKNQDVNETGDVINLSIYQQALVCPGSVGQPRNGCPDTQFAIYDKARQQVSFIRLPYDNLAVIAQMRRHFLPEALSLRLLKGQ